MTRKLLIIDDEKSIRQILEIALEEEWTVYSAASGTEGIALANEVQPDLILLDRMMPGLDGLSTLKELKANQETAKIPVIFLTAKVQAQDLGDYTEKDVLGVLSKPFDPIMITEDIDEMLSRSKSST